MGNQNSEVAGSWKSLWSREKSRGKLQIQVVVLWKFITFIEIVDETRVPEHTPPPSPILYSLIGTRTPPYLAVFKKLRKKYLDLSFNGVYSGLKPILQPRLVEIRFFRCVILLTNRPNFTANKCNFLKKDGWSLSLNSRLSNSDTLGRWPARSISIQRSGKRFDTGELLEAPVDKSGSWSSIFKTINLFSNKAVCGMCSIEVK